VLAVGLVEANRIRGDWDRHTRR